MKMTDCFIFPATAENNKGHEEPARPSIIRFLIVLLNKAFAKALEKCFHILVIDDGSPDGTAQIVHRLMDTEFGDRLFIIERSGKLGLGTAYIAGFKWAIEHNYDYIFEKDADFSHDPNDLPRNYAP